MTLAHTKALREMSVVKSQNFMIQFSFYYQGEDYFWHFLGGGEHGCMQVSVYWKFKES